MQGKKKDIWKEEYGLKEDGGKGKGIEGIKKDGGKTEDKRNETAFQ